MEAKARTRAPKYDVFEEVTVPAGPDVDDEEFSAWALIHAGVSAANDKAAIKAAVGDRAGTFAVVRSGEFRTRTRGQTLVDVWS